MSGDVREAKRKEGLIFTVRNFRPRSEQVPYERGRYEFSVHLDREFARRAKATKIDGKTRARFGELGKEMVTGLIWPGRLMGDPYRFCEDTLLIQECRVLGDNRYVGATWSRIADLDDPDPNPRLDREYLEFNSGNVDNAEQAYALLALFGLWVDYSSNLMRTKA